MRTFSIFVVLLAMIPVAHAEETAPSRIDSITKSARDMMPAMPSMPSVALPSMPDLSLPDFSDATGKLMTEFNTFTQQVGDALPILEQMGYEVTTFKVTWGTISMQLAKVDRTGPHNLRRYLCGRCTTGSRVDTGFWNRLPVRILPAAAVTKPEKT